MLPAPRIMSPAFRKAFSAGEPGSIEEKRHEITADEIQREIAGLIEDEDVRAAMRVVTKKKASGEK